MSTISLKKQKMCLFFQTSKNPIILPQCDSCQLLGRSNQAKKTNTNFQIFCKIQNLLQFCFSLTFPNRTTTGGLSSVVQCAAVNMK